MSDTTVLESVEPDGLFHAWAEKAIAEHATSQSVIAAQQRVIDAAVVAVKEYHDERGSKPWLIGMLNLLAELSRSGLLVPAGAVDVPQQ